MNGDEFQDDEYQDEYDLDELQYDWEHLNDDDNIFELKKQDKYDYLQDCVNDVVNDMLENNMMIGNDNIFTTTNVVSTNLILNLDWFFNICEIEDMSRYRKIKSKKTLNDKIKNDKYLRHGTFTMIQYLNNIRGLKIEECKNLKNSISLNVFIGKLVNVKIPYSGKMHLTGCLSFEHVVECIRVIINALSKYEMSDNTYVIDGGVLKCMVHRVMTNVNFSLGYEIDIQKLNWYMNTCREDFISILESSIGSNGVNIKLPCILDMNSKVETFNISITNGEAICSSRDNITFKEYLDTLQQKDKNRLLKKQSFTTFIVFYSGKVIMTGINMNYMIPVYVLFMSVMKQARDQIEEKIIEGPAKCICNRNYTCFGCILKTNYGKRVKFLKDI